MATSQDSERNARNPSDLVIDVEILGRQRPPAFCSLRSELCCCLSRLGSMLLVGFHVILPLLSDELDIPQASHTWPANVFSLVTGAFLLPIGQVDDMYGGHLRCNGAWLLVRSLVAAFSQNYLMLISWRALQEPAAYLPAGVMLLGRLYRPGPRKNLVFVPYGAFSPVGFFLGILMGGHRRAVVDLAMVSLPGDHALMTIVLLVVYTITDSSHAPKGWATSYIIATLVIGVVFLIAAWYVETRVTSQPLLPQDLFAPRYMKPLVVVALFTSYGVFGPASLLLELLHRADPAQDPLNHRGVARPHDRRRTRPRNRGRLHAAPPFRAPPARHLSSPASPTPLCVLLFAFRPEDPNYWAYVFPAMVCATMGINITYTVSNNFITTSLPAPLQGLVGALINVLVYLGISFWLVMGDVAAGQTSHLGLRRSYQAALWLAVGVAAFSTALCVFRYAKSDLTVEEQQQLEAEVRAAAGGIDQEEREEGHKVSS